MGFERGHGASAEAQIAAPEILCGAPEKSHDDQNLTQWDFSPIAPLVKCPSGS